jgi:hypothetical protein
LNQHIQEKQELFLCTGVYYLYEPTQQMKIPVYESSELRATVNLRQETVLVIDDQHLSEVSCDPTCTYNSVSDQIIVAFKLAHAPLAFVLAIPGQYLPKNIIPGGRFSFLDLDSSFQFQVQSYIASLNGLFV